MFIKIKCTQDKTHHFNSSKVNLVAFSTFTVSCNHHPYIGPEDSCLPKRRPCPHEPSLPIPLAATDLLSISTHGPVLGPSWTWS